MYSFNNYCAPPVKEFPAFGIALNTEEQPISTGQALRLPNNNSNQNPNASIPILLDVESTEFGLRVKRNGVYQLSYTLTVSLDNMPPLSPPNNLESAIFFLTLNDESVPNVIPGSGTAVRASSAGTGQAVVTSSIILINLNKEDLIQIVPSAVTGTVTAQAATLTAVQIA